MEEILFYLAATGVVVGVAAAAVVGYRYYARDKKPATTESADTETSESSISASTHTPAPGLRRRPVGAARSATPPPPDSSESWDITSPNTEDPAANNQAASTGNTAYDGTLHRDRTLLHKASQAFIGTVRGKQETPSELVNRLLLKVIAYCQTESHLDQKGVLRESSDLVQAKDLYKLLAEEDSEIPAGTDIHVAVSMLKHALNTHMNKIHCDKTNDSRQSDLLTAIDKLQSSQSSEALFATHIQALVHQGKQAQASIMHNLLHLGYLVQSHSAKNLMTASNVAKILAAQMINLLKIQFSGDMREQSNKRVSLNSYLEGLIEPAITSAHFSRCATIIDTATAKRALSPGRRN